MWLSQMRYFDVLLTKFLLKHENDLIFWHFWVYVEYIFIVYIITSIEESIAFCVETLTTFYVHQKLHE